MSQGGDDDGDAACLLGHDPDDCKYNEDGNRNLTADTGDKTVKRGTRTTFETGAGRVAKDADPLTAAADRPAALRGHTFCPVCERYFANSLLDE